jgi:hypothetical protein
MNQPRKKNFLCIPYPICLNLDSRQAHSSLIVPMTLSLQQTNYCAARIPFLISSKLWRGN